MIFIGRPYQWVQTVNRAATLADKVADPQLAAVIVLSAVYRHPPTVRRATVGATAIDGSIVGIDWGGCGRSHRRYGGHWPPSGNASHNKAPVRTIRCYPEPAMGGWASQRSTKNSANSTPPQACGKTHPTRTSTALSLTGDPSSTPSTRSIYSNPRASDNHCRIQ